MSGFSKILAIIALVLAALSSSAQARGPGTHANDAKFYGPVYGWRYSPPPAAASAYMTLNGPSARAGAAEIIQPNRETSSPHTT